MASELLKSVLVLVIAFVLRMALTAIGVQLDEVVFNTIVAALVAYVLALVGVEAAKKAAPKTFK